MEGVFREARLIGSTLTSASPDGPLKHFHKAGLVFDVVVVDEAAQVPFSLVGM